MREVKVSQSRLPLTRSSTDSAMTLADAGGGKEDTVYLLLRLRRRWGPLPAPSEDENEA